MKKSITIGLCTFMCFVAAMTVSLTSVQAQGRKNSERKTSETAVNSEYREIIMEHLSKDVEARQRTMQKKAEAILQALPNDEKLYDESFMTIRAYIAPGVTEEGTPEVNFVYEISYNCKHLEGTEDDYPLGSYDCNESNSCRAICGLTKMLLESECKDIFAKGKKATIEIHSTTDATDISHLDYHGEYGEFKYCPVSFNGEQLRISVNETDGINNNAQLAYIRAHSMKAYLEGSVSVLRNTENEFLFLTRCLPEIGSQYRRSSIVITVHSPFDDKIVEMNEKLINDEYVDYNIPKAKEPDGNSSTFVLIIADEDYPAPIPPVPFADNDGEILQQYCVKALGIPERHVKVLNNANKNDILVEGVDWLKDITVAVKGEANIIVYYAGHALTDPNFNPYLLPSGVDVTKIGVYGAKKGKKVSPKTKSYTDRPLGGGDLKRLLEEAISLDSMCIYFSRVNFTSMTFIIDASFNGVDRNGDPLFNIKMNNVKMRGLRIRGNIVVFNAADFNKTAYAFNEQHHGFLTYFLLKELKRTKGDITFKDLYTNIEKMVSYESSLQNKLQEPTMIIGGKRKDTWDDLKFIK